MSEPVTQTTEAVEVAVPKSLDSLSETQYARWQKTGEVPTEVKRESAAETTEEPAEVTAEPAPESDPGAKQEKPSKMGYGQLRALLKEKEAEIERLKTSPKEPRVEPTVEREPEPAAETKEAKEPRPRSGDLDKDGKAKYATWEDYEDALLAWNTEQVISKFESSQQKRQQEQTIAEKNRTIQQSWEERTTKAREKHADFDTVAISPEGPGKDIRAGSVVDQWILDSSLGAELLYHFGKNRSELKRIGSMEPIPAARELTKLEARLSGEEDPPVPEVRTTKTPPPARDIGGRGTTAGDDVIRAVNDNDAGAFIAAENRRMLALRKSPRG